MRASNCIVTAHDEKRSMNMSEGILLRNGRQAKWSLSPTFVIVMTIFIDITGFGMIIPLLPFYAETFQAGSTALGILVASFAVMQFIFSPILGRISDSVGRRPVLLLSILISSVSFTLFTIANSFLMLLLSRIISGMATETAVAQAYISDITSKKERATGIGRVAAAHGVGFIIGPAIGGLLSVHGFWAPGLAAVILTSVNLLFVFLFLPESMTHASSRMRITTNFVGGYLRKLTDALTKPLIGSVLVVFFITFLAFSAIPVILPLLGISFFGINEVQMSYVFMYIGLIQVILQGFVIGRLTEKFGDEKLIVLGPVLMIVGMFLMPLIPNIVAFLVLIALIASGSGIMRTVVPSFVSKRSQANEQGSMLGVTQAASSIARVPGPLIGGSVFEFAGVAAPFFLGVAMLVVAFGLAVKVLMQKIP